MKNLLKILVASIFLISVSYAGPLDEVAADMGIDEPVMKYPMSGNLIQSTAWSLIMSELEFTLKVRTCGILPGVEAHMIEPVGYFEYVNEPLNFPFIGVKIKSSAIKFGAQRESDAAAEAIRGTSNNTHYVYVPILGLILKKTDDFWCLHRGPVAVKYLSEFDPEYRNDFLKVKMIPHMVAMFSPDNIVSGVVDCIASEVSAQLYGFDVEVSPPGDDPDTAVEGYDTQEFFDQGYQNGQSDNGTWSKIKSSSRDTVNTIRNSIYFVDGCNGFASIGGYVDGNDPITDAMLEWNDIDNMVRGGDLLYRIPNMDKQPEIRFNPIQSQRNPIPSTWCAPRSFPFPIVSETPLQEAYPVIGGPHEMGQSGASVSTGKYLPGAEGVVFVVWQRRDYVAFAYLCPTGKKKK